MEIEFNETHALWPGKGILLGDEFLVHENFAKVIWHFANKWKRNFSPTDPKGDWKEFLMGSALIETLMGFYRKYKEDGDGGQHHNLVFDIWHVVQGYASICEKMEALQRERKEETYGMGACRIASDIFSEQEFKLLFGKEQRNFKFSPTPPAYT